MKIVVSTHWGHAGWSGLAVHHLGGLLTQLRSKEGEEAIQQGDRRRPQRGHERRKNISFEFLLCARSIFFLHADICGGVKSLSVRARNVCVSVCVCVSMAKE